MKSHVSQQWQVFFAMAGILLLAAISRMLYIGDQALWIDEGATYFIIKQPDLIYALAHFDHHPPLYYLLLKLWIVFCGDSVVSLRLFSAFPSILSVAAVFPLAKVLNRNRAHFSGILVPLGASLILALSDPEFVLAQDIRMYSLRTLFTILMVYSYVKWTENPSLKWTLSWIGTSVFLVHLQYQGIFVIGAMGLHSLFFLGGQQRIRAIGIYVIIGLLFSPWFFTYGLHQSSNDPGIQASLPSNWQTLSELRHKYFSAQWPLMLGLFLLGIVTLRADGRVQFRPFSATFLLLAWFLLTVLVTFILNFWFPVLAPHRLLLVSPVIAILIAQGLQNIPSNIGRIFIVAVIVIYGITTVDDYYPKEPWDEVGESVALYAEPNQMALLEVYRGDNPLIYYLDHLMPEDTTIMSMRHHRDLFSDEYPTAIVEAIDAHETVWLTHWSPDPSAFEFLHNAGFQQTALLPVDHWGNTISTYRFDRFTSTTPIVEFTSNMQIIQTAMLDDRIDLWWSAEQTLPVDYSVSVFVLDANGALVLQHDAFPFENRRSTTSWQANEIIYDPHPLDIASLPSGEYTLNVKVYTYFDNQIYPTMTGEDWYTVYPFTR